MLLGDVPLAEGERLVGRRTVIGAIGQERAGYAGEAAARRRAHGENGARARRCTHAAREVRARQDHIDRPCSSLSPGERTRAHLAELQARGVNLLVLDEPTNHLDLEAVEQLESALVDYAGTLVVVSHDRRFLERIAPTRELKLPL